MIFQPGGYASPTLESYSLEPMASLAISSREARTDSAQPAFTITLNGSNFITRAMMPIIRIGDLWIQDYRIIDEHTILCNLHEMPEEGAPISISYGSSQRAELAEGFSMRKLSEGPPSVLDEE